MRQFVVILVFDVLVSVLAGCARFPASSTSVTPAQTIYSEIMLQGSINPSYYYFFALGTDQTSNSGPVPVPVGNAYTNGWGTINNLPAGQVQQPPYFVQFNNGTFEQFDGVTGQPLGAPYHAGTRFDGQYWHIYVEIDQSLLTKYNLLPAGTTSPIVQANWITVTSLTVPPQENGLLQPYDGFGVNGNGYLTPIALNSVQSWTSGQAGVPAQPAGETTTASTINGVYDPGYSLDIIWWTLSVKIYQ